jgi:Rieske Fe-S protein
MAELGDQTPGQETSAVARRTVLRAAGLLGLTGAGAAALSACAEASASTAEAPKGPSVATSKVPVGGGVILEDADYVITQPSKGQYKAFSKICTHQGCPVASVEDGVIHCNCHGSEYSIKDGSVTNPPATKGLAVAKTTVFESKVYVTD